MSKFIDSCLYWLYNPTINLMDIAVLVFIIPALVSYSLWFGLLILPWIIYSIHMQNKYWELP